MLSKIEKQLKNGTVAIHLLKLIPFIFLPGIMPNLFSNLLKLLHEKKMSDFLDSNSSRDFWHLANNISNNFTALSFPPLLQPDGSTAVSSFSKAELFAQTFATNSILDDTGHNPPTPPPSDYSIPKILILHYDVVHALSGLDLILERLTVWIESLLLFSKTVLPSLLPT